MITIYLGQEQNQIAQGIMDSLDIDTLDYPEHITHSLCIPEDEGTLVMILYFFLLHRF